MKTYKEILDRIVEIIKLSEKKQQELEAMGIFDKDKKPEEKDFKVFYPYVIYKEYVSEFDDLINREKTFYLLYKNENVGIKNQNLITACEAYINADSVNKNSYEQVINILKNSIGKTANDLVEYSGYFIVREELPMFKALCKQLQIGPGVLLVNANASQMLKDREEEQKNHSLQIGRIKKQIATIATKTEVEAELIEKDIELENAKKKLEEIPKEETPKDIKPQLNCDFKEIIYWGMLGYLNLKMITELKTVLTNEEFERLINTLKEYNIFSEQELIDVQIKANARTKTITDIDELVAFFAIRKDINMDGLKALIPSIGIANYHYLIDQLFKFGAISFDVYKEYLEENNYIVKDENNMTR